MAVDSIKVKEPGTVDGWLRPFARLRWLLGFERQELEVQAYTDAVYAVVAGSANRRPELAPLAGKLSDLREKLDMASVMACERQYYSTLDGIELRAELWSLRERFERIGSPVARAQYEQVKVTDLENATDARVAAELNTLLGYAHKSYGLFAKREIAVSRLKGWLLSIVCISLLLSGIALLASRNIVAQRPVVSTVAALGLLALTGAVGAAMSVANRLQNAVGERVLAQDPVSEIAALELGKASIILSCVVGAVSALIVFSLLLAGGRALLGEGGLLIPSFNIDPWLGQRPGLSEALALKRDSDLAKVLVFAFVAGFAERLVPDAIDRIVAELARNKNSELRTKGS